MWATERHVSMVHQMLSAVSSSGQRIEFLECLVGIKAYMYVLGWHMIQSDAKR